MSERLARGSYVLQHRRYGSLVELPRWPFVWVDLALAWLFGFRRVRP